MGNDIGLKLKVEFRIMILSAERSKAQHKLTEINSYIFGAKYKIKKSRAQRIYENDKGVVQPLGPVFHICGSPLPWS